MTLTFPFCVQLAYPKGSHRSSPQPLRSTAHQMIAGKNKPVSSLPSQGSAKRQQQLAALQLTLQSAPAVLQDMASHAAEAVAVCYLAEARSGLSGEHPSIAIIACQHCPLLRQITRCKACFIMLARADSQSVHATSNQDSCSCSVPLLADVLIGMK